MSLLSWSRQLSVGVKEIDDQHMVLVALANRLNDALRDGRGPDELENIIDELVRYAETHFAWEERLMAQQRYPLLQQHCAEHRELMHAAHQFQERMRRGETQLSAGVMRLLRDWLSRHIMNSDMMLGRELNRKGLH